MTRLYLALAAGLLFNPPLAHAQASGQNCSTVSGSYRCLIKVSDLVEATSYSPSQAAPIARITIVADGVREAERMLDDVELLLSVLLPATTEVARRDAVVELIGNIDKRRAPKTRIGTFDFASSQRDGKMILEGNVRK